MLYFFTRLLLHNFFKCFLVRSQKRYHHQQDIVSILSLPQSGLQPL